MNPLIKQVLDTLSRLGNSQLVALFNVLDFENCGVFGVLAKGEFISHNSEITFKFKKTPLEKVILSGRTSTYPGKLLKKVLLPFPTYEKNNSTFDCLCLPLLGAEEEVVTGVVVLAQKTDTSLPSARLQMLQMLMPMVANIVEMTQENERWIQLATKDELTKLYTRPYFEMRLQEEVTRTRRHGDYFSILRIDMDHFKQINADYGYRQGNSVLQEFAKILADSVRQGIDIACRYSGQQFMVLLPNTSVDGAYVLAERIRHSCVQHFFRTGQGTTLKITVSIGIAQNIDTVSPENDEKASADNHHASYQVLSKEEILALSDSMLEIAKKTGRDKIMVS
jgi:diguanylate cyclase (GGDEF)-like protein